VNRTTTLLISPALAVAVLDQLTKYMVVQGLKLHSSVELIQGFLNLVHVRNRGIAFGMFHGLSSGTISYILAAVSILAIIVISCFAVKHSNGSRIMTAALSLIVGGAAGNLIDRLRIGEVIDFIDVYIGTYHWPAFNVADSAITMGTFLFIAGHLFNKNRA